MTRTGGCDTSSMMSFLGGWLLATLCWIVYISTTTHLLPSMFRPSVKPLKEPLQREPVRQGQQSPADVDVLKAAKIPYKVISGEQLYSTHHCVGDSYNPERSYEIRSCRYRNVCFVNNELHYYKLPSHVMPRQDELDTMIPPMGRMERDFSRFRMRPAIKHADDFPSQAPYFTADGSEEVVTLMFSEYNSKGFGHHTSDVLLPIFRLAQIFGMEKLRSRMLLVDNFNPPYLWSCQHSPWHLCDFWYKNYTGLYMQDNALPLSQKSFENTTLCFKELLAGIGYLAEHATDVTGHGEFFPAWDTANVGRGATFWDFRNEVLRRLHLPALPSMKPPEKYWDVIFHNNDGHRCNTNFTRTQLLLNKIRPSIVQANIDWKAYSVRDQIEMATRTKVMVAIHGGGAHVAYYLPRHASFFILWWKKGPRNNDLTNHGEYHTWNNIAHLRVKWVPNEDTPFHKDTWLAPKGQEPLYRYVDEENLAEMIDEAIDWFDRHRDLAMEYFGDA